MTKAQSLLISALMAGFGFGNSLTPEALRRQRRIIMPVGPKAKGSSKYTPAGKNKNVPEGNR